MRLLSLIFAVVITLMAVACGKSARSPSVPEATATPEATTSATTVPTGVSLRRTGIEDVDAVIDAVLSGDFDTLHRLVGFARVACSTTAFHTTPCGPGEADGTLVDAFPISSVLGIYYRSENVDPFLRSLLSDKISLYAVYLAPSDFWPPGDYVAVFSRDILGAGVIGEELVIGDGRLVGAGHAHQLPPEQLAQYEHLDKAILPPP